MGTGPVHSGFRVWKKPTQSRLEAAAKDDRLGVGFWTGCDSGCCGPWCRGGWCGGS